MKAVVCHALGEPADLVLDNVESPQVGPEEIKVALSAAAVNFADILMVQGKYQFKPPLPFSPGFEGAGQVMEIGSKITGFQVGDRVMTHHRYGGYVEEIVLPETALRPLPEQFSFVEGAAFSGVYNTAYVSLCSRANLKKGEVLLVHGASGGGGLAAVEIGKVLGATVIATASSAEKLAVVQKKKADHLINYSDGFKEKVLEVTEGRGADVIYDPVGGDVFDESTRCIAWGGRLLVVGFAGGRIAEIKTNIPLLKGFSIVGVRAGEFGRRDLLAAQENFTVMLDWVKQGKIHPYVSQTFPLEQAVQAMELLATRQAFGKVVLTIREM